MSTIVSVTNLSELYSALSTAKSGEIIELAGGNYGKMDLSKKSGFDLTFPSEVTITSADPENPAIFSGLDIREASNLTFDGVTFDYTFEAGDKIYYRPFSISSSEDITIRNSTFDGDLASGVSDVDDGYGFAVGLSVRGSQGVNVENNEFFEFYRGAVISESGDVVVSGNDIHSIRMDGLNFAQIDSAIIEDNYIHDFRGSKESLDHSDMIQFWTNGTDSPSSDIVIRGNLLDIGEGSATQSIFMRNDLVDRGMAGTEMFYQNITIEENTIVNGHAHGITVGETDGLVINNNTVLHADGDTPDGLDPQVEIPRINVAVDSKNVTLNSNITAGITGQEGQLDWTVRNNAFVQEQDSNAPGYYGDVFVTSSLDLVDGIHQFRALNGSMVDTLGAGASAIRDIPQDAGLFAQIHVTPNAENMSQYNFDASFSMLEGQPLPAGAEYLWTFGDGSTASGAQVNHAFPQGGAYDVALTINLPDGTSTGRTLNLAVDDAALISMTSDVGTDTALSGLEQIDLGSSGSSLSVARENVANLLGQNEFNISMGIAAETTQSMGEITRLHGSFIAAVKDDGNLYLRIFQDTGEQLKITTQGLTLNDTARHDINISLNDGILDITVDGSIVSSTEMSGTLASTGTHDLTFGNPFGAPNFVGTLSSFEISVNESDFGQVVEPVTISMPQENNSAEVLVPTANYDSVVSLEKLEALTSVYVPSGPVVTSNDQIAPIEKELEAPTEVAREDIAHVLGKDAFEISFNLSAANSEGAGEVMRLHQSFVINVTDKGELYTQLFDTDGNRIRLATEGANLTDTTAHDIKITYENNRVEIFVDDKVLSSAEMTSPLADIGRHDLTFGNPWRDDKFDGKISGLEMTTAEDVYTMPPPTVTIMKTSSYSSIFDTTQGLSETVNQVDQFENMFDPLQASFFG